MRVISVLLFLISITCSDAIRSALLYAEQDSSIFEVASSPESESETEKEGESKEDTKLRVESSITSWSTSDDGLPCQTVNMDHKKVSPYLEIHGPPPDLIAC